MSADAGIGSPPLFERRREHRVRLSIPLEVKRVQAGTSVAMPHVASAGQCIDLSAGGVLLSLSNGGMLVPGDLMRVEIQVPWELRNRVPFSRISANARVVRAAADDSSTTVALAFCDHGASRLGSIVHP